MNADNASADIAVSPKHSTQVRVQQVRALYQQAPLAVLSNFIVPSLLVGIVWDAVHQREAIVWLGAMFVIGTARAILMFAYYRAAPDSARISRWGSYYSAGALIAGCLWGVAGLLLYVPGAMDYHVLLGLVLGGMCTGAVASHGAHLLTYYLFSVPTMLPYVVRSFVEGDKAHIVISLLALFYLVAMSFFARNFNRALTEAWVLRFENIDLVAHLKEKKEEAERANIAKSRFLAAASHDLRQPLHAMALFTSALQEKSPYGELRTIADKLSVSVEALEGLFHALLDVSKLDAGVVVPEVRDFRMQTLFDRMAPDYSGQAADKGLRLRWRPTSVVVRSDSMLLERILRNLVSNAIHYTDAGGVLIGCRRRGGKIRIDVIDSGIGIAPAHLTDIFQEFYQIGNPERDRTKGLGLGLAIVHRLASLLKHAVQVRSVPGRGSVFSVTVSRGDVAAVEHDLSVAGDFIDTKLGNPLIVVIDDEQAVLDGMCEVLQEWGARPLLAGSGDEALARLADSGERPSAVVADYRLRHAETGIAAIGRIKDRYGADIPGVLVTGDTAPDRLREAEASGYHLLHKPIRPASLHALLRFLLSAPDSQRAAGE